MVLKVYKSKALGFSLRVLHDDGACNRPACTKNFLNALVRPMLWKVLDVDVGPVVCSSTLSTLLEFPNENFLSSNHHTVNLFDCVLRSLEGLKMDKTVSKRVTFSVSNNLARKNVSEKRKGICKCLVVNTQVQVLDKNISCTSFTKRWIPLRPHHTAWTVLDQGVVHGIQSTFGISHMMKVDVGVAKGATCYCITADTDGSNGSDSVKDVKQ
mmetsp:Transcript_13351/g.21824  ORF Transcript_13351/g.21824 Transcript_13351/m.21824 type:complete len:212 (-) Transcript_13351:263-898(-)